MKNHRYNTTVEWLGNSGSGTSGYAEYGRQYVISTAGKVDISGSADPAFLGDPALWNPEELFLSAISACHQLWYLHLCSDAGVTVLKYTDNAEAVLSEKSGTFVSMALYPQVTIKAGDDAALAISLHELASSKCYLANTLNLKVNCIPTIN